MNTQILRIPPTSQTQAAAELRFIEDEIEHGSYQMVYGREVTAVMHFDMRESWQWESHSHDEHQLLWAPDGAVTLQTEQMDWLVPATVALWIPAGIVHGVAGSRAGQVHVLYFDCVRNPSPLSTVTPLTVGPLARELLLYLDGADLTPEQRASAEAILLDVLRPVSTTALHIPIPRDSRARVVAEAIIADPADTRDLADWAWRAHTSERTLRRLFAEETSMAFTQWRLHVRMRAAMQLLGDGRSVSSTARKVGYGTTASFITAFGRVTGTTPSAHRGLVPTNSVRRT